MPGACPTTTPTPHLFFCSPLFFFLYFFISFLFLFYYYDDDDCVEILSRKIRFFGPIKSRFFSSLQFFISFDFISFDFFSFFSFYYSLTDAVPFTSWNDYWYSWKKMGNIKLWKARRFYKYGLSIYNFISDFFSFSHKNDNRKSGILFLNQKLWKIKEEKNWMGNLN